MKLLKVLWYVVTLYGPVLDAILGIKSGIDKAKCDRDFERFVEERQHFCDVDAGNVNDLYKGDEK